MREIGFFDTVEVIGSIPVVPIYVFQRSADPQRLRALCDSTLL
jgi:hypothetical protein